MEKLEFDATRLAGVLDAATPLEPAGDELAVERRVPIESERVAAAEPVAREPIAGNDTEAGRAQNRRTEITVN